MTWNRIVIVIVIFAVAVLLIGVLVIVARRCGGGPADEDTSVVRAWTAVLLVVGLVVLCVIALGPGFDKQLRSTLIGGLVTSVGSVVAFYFASRQAAQSSKASQRTDVDTTTVPDIRGKTREQAKTLLEGGGLKMETDPGVAVDDSALLVVDEYPRGGSTVLKGSRVLVRFGEPLRG